MNDLRAAARKSPFSLPRLRPMQMEFKDGRSAMHEHQRGRPVSLSLCAVTHIVIHYSKPPLLLMPLLLNGKAVFFSLRRARNAGRRLFGRTDADGRKKRKRESGINGLITFSLSLSLSAAVFEPLAPKRGEEQERWEEARVTELVNLGIGGSEAWI